MMAELQRFFKNPFGNGMVYRTGDLVRELLVSCTAGVVQ